MLSILPTKLVLEDIKHQGQCLHDQIPNTKTKISRIFFISLGGIHRVNMLVSI